MKGIVVGVYTESSDTCNTISSFTVTFNYIDGKTSGQLSKILEATGPFYKDVKQRLIWSALLTIPLGEIVPGYFQGKLSKEKTDLDFDCISVVDLGSKDEKDNPLEGYNQKSENVRCATAGGLKALKAASQFDIIYLDGCDDPQAVAEAAYLTHHGYDQLKKKSSKCKAKLELFRHPNIDSSYEREFAKGVVIAESQNFARLLAETPANHMTPSIFASTVIEKFKSTDVEIIVRDKEWAESMKMGAFLSVAKGSEEPPKFLELHYNGLPDSEKHFAFVGKGITFDSGGISLKPSTDMDKMRADMGGAACVVGTLLAAASLKLKINLKGFIPLTENLPNGKANKPGDVVFAMNGKSIQIDNTDAEGRLVLSDALCYAQKLKPEVVIDVATLTGAMSMAIGTAAAGVFSNNDELWQQLEQSGYLTGDRVWRFPLFSHFTKDITAPLADLNNMGKSRKAGACTAAAFLKEFIEPDMKWMHMDMSCVKENKDDVPYLSSGMSGRPTRTFVQFLNFLADK